MSSAVFTSTTGWNPERIRAMAIYCSDGRWGEAFDEFCHNCLGIPRYDRFAVPGGPAWLTLRDASLTLAFDVARHQMEFLVRAHRLERIVLITHYGCAFYSELLGLDADECVCAQTADARAAAANLRGWFGELEIEGFAAMRSGEQVSFSRLEL